MEKNLMVTRNWSNETIRGLVVFTGVGKYPYEFIGDDGRTHTYGSLEQALSSNASVVEVSDAEADEWKRKYAKNWRHGGYKGRVLADGSFLSVKQVLKELGGA